MADLSAGIPPRVWDHAKRVGLHNDCIVSGRACDQCDDVIMRSFEEIYGSAQTMDEVIGMIAFDLAQEHERSQS